MAPSVSLTFWRVVSLLDAITKPDKFAYAESFRGQVCTLQKGRRPVIPSVGRRRSSKAGLSPAAQNARRRAKAERRTKLAQPHLRQPPIFWLRLRSCYGIGALPKKVQLPRPSAISRLARLTHRPQEGALPSTPLVLHCAHTDTPTRLAGSRFCSQDVRTIANAPPLGVRPHQFSTASAVRSCHRALSTKASRPGFTGCRPTVSR
jgi:hypothetical protein